MVADDPIYESALDPVFIVQLLRQFLGAPDQAAAASGDAEPLGSSQQPASSREEAGCLLWDLSASPAHAAFLLDSAALPVLHATLRAALSEVASAADAAAAAAAQAEYYDAAVEGEAMQMNGSSTAAHADDGADNAAGAAALAAARAAPQAAKEAQRTHGRLAEIALGILGNIASHPGLSARLVEGASSAGGTGGSVSGSGGSGGGSAGDGDAALRATGVQQQQEGGPASGEAAAGAPGGELVQAVVRGALCGCDDAPVLLEACRLVAVAAEQQGRDAWLEEATAAPALSRLAWVASNTLRPDLLQRCAEAMAAICRQHPPAALQLAALGVVDIVAAACTAFASRYARAAGSGGRGGVSSGGGGWSPDEDGARGGSRGRVMQQPPGIGHEGAAAAIAEAAEAAAATAQLAAVALAPAEGGAVEPTEECVEALLFLVEDMAESPGCETVLLQHAALPGALLALLACGDSGDRIPDAALRAAATLQDACGPLAARDPVAIARLLALCPLPEDADAMANPGTGHRHHQQQQQGEEGRGEQQQAGASHPAFVVLAAAMASLQHAAAQQQQSGSASAPTAALQVDGDMMRVLCDTSAWQRALEALSRQGRRQGTADPAGVFTLRALRTVLRSWLAGSAEAGAGEGGKGRSAAADAAMCADKARQQLEDVEVALGSAARGKRPKS